PHPPSPLFPYTTLFRSCQRFVDAALVERQRDAVRARQRGDRLDDIAHVGELREGLRRQERAVLEMPHASAVLVTQPALLRRRRRDRKSTRLNSSHLGIS